MNLLNLVKQLVPQINTNTTVPSYLFGAFRRKTISFYNGQTDEKTIVYWFQSPSFTIDLRLKHETDTVVFERQGWIGNTFWDEQSQLLSWDVTAQGNFQNHIQWPEPAKLHAIGNAILEFSPSNVYVEDWRQQVKSGLYLGLKVVKAIDLGTAEHLALEGGLIICDDHVAFALSRLPETQTLVENINFKQCDALYEKALESFEVSVGLDGQLKLYSTGSHHHLQSFDFDNFNQIDEHHLTQKIEKNGRSILLTYQIDVYQPYYQFMHTTSTTPQSQDWLEQEAEHLMHHAEQVF